jgi:hypothetical protein
MTGDSVNSRRLLAICGAVLLLLLAIPVASASAYKGFETPSGNIGCLLTEQGARCDIRQHDWPNPKKPRSCEFDYGSIEVHAHGRGGYGCISDSVMGIGGVLGYGESIRKGRFECTSEEAGVRCVNRRNGHGFFLSRQSVRFF